MYTLKVPHFVSAIEAICKHQMHLPGLAMELICKRSTILQQGDYRETGLVLTISQMTLSKNILITKRASDAELGATSSSNGDLNPVNPIKCLLLRKERN